MAKDNLIRVRVKGTAPRNGKIKKFKPMKELPVPGTQIGNGDYYGGASKLTMSIYQNARDEDKLPLYDYYEVDILDSRLLKRDVDYICIPHRAASIIPISMYNELIKTAQKYDDVGGCPGTDTVEAGSGGVTVVFGLLFKGGCYSV